MTDGPSGSSGEDIWHPKGNPWIIAVAVTLAAFMEVLDTSIANVALPHIAGNLGASNDESTWVLTIAPRKNKSSTDPRNSGFHACRSRYLARVVRLFPSLVKTPEK
jgi:hypothetical protein